MTPLKNHSNTKVIGKAKTQKPKLPKRKVIKKKSATKQTTTSDNTSNTFFAIKTKKEFPNEFPFWARLKISKNRTTLVIDEENYLDKKLNKNVAGFVHREATSIYHKGFEEIKPNPDEGKRPNAMYLKSPRRLPKRMFQPHNKELEMPKSLKDRYSKNNKKNKKKNYNPTLSAIPCKQG